jgi:hypothetical protein
MAQYEPKHVTAMLFFLNEQLLCLADTYWFLYSTLQQATTSFCHTTSIASFLITRHQTTPFIDIVTNSTNQLAFLAETLTRGG